MRQNARTTGLRFEVVQARVATFLTRQPQAFNVVFADPPYDMSNAEIEGMLALLAGGWLSPGALAVIERSRRTAPFAWPHGFADASARGYGETTLYYATYRTTEES